MVRIDDVWESARDVLRVRARMLAPVALLAFALPGSARAAVAAFGGSSPGWAAGAAAVSLVALLVGLWGQLTVVAVGSDSALSRRDAGALALRRVPAALLIALLLGAAVVVAALPVVAILWATGFDFRGAAQPGGAALATMTPVAVLFSLSYGLIVAAAALWLVARLFLINPVIVNEARRIGAIGRSVTLSRGMTFQLIGAALVFGIVYLVASFAARAVVFVVVRLILGASLTGVAAWLGGSAAALIGAGFNVVVGVFAARLYMAVTAAPAARATID